MKIGILGFGSMGKTHAYSIANLKYFYSPLPFKAEVAGITTRNPARTAELVEQYGVGKVYLNEDDMINDPEIDVIDICTPNIAHYETLKKAIAAGKNIYCEKPLCVTAAEAKEIAELAREKGIIGGIVFNTRFLLPVMRAKELIDAGRIGKPLSFRASFLHSSSADPNKIAGWKQNKDICGGGVLFDLGSHAIDMIYHLCGEFESVSGLSQIAYETRRGMDGSDWQTNADEAFYMTATLKCGAKGTVTCGKIMHGTNDDHSFEIYGTKGALRFDLMEPNFLWFYDAEKPERERGFTKVECCGRYDAPGGVFPGVKAPIGWLRGHVGSMYNYLSAVYENRQPAPSFDDAAHIQAVMEAAYISDETGERRKV